MPQETEFHKQGPILTGHFVETDSYHVVRKRGTPDWLLIYTVSGWGRFGFRGGEFISQKGDTVLLAPGTFHDYGIEPEKRHWELRWAHFEPLAHWLELLRWPAIAPGLLRVHVSGNAARRNVTTALAEMDRYAAGPLQRASCFAMNALERALLHCDAANPRNEQAHWDARILNSLEFLSDRYAEPLTLDAMARVCGLSPSRFAHLFREVAGETPMRYLEKIRMRRAGDLLVHSGRSITEIAGMVGYENPFYFTNRFKKITGVNPSQYRKANR